MLRQVRNQYVFAYVLAIAASLCGFFCFDWNLFPEIGASLIIWALIRGSSEVRNFDWSEDGIKGLYQGIQARALKWDLAAGIIGTGINGFSVWLYALLTAVFGSRVQEPETQETTTALLILMRGGIT